MNSKYKYRNKADLYSKSYKSLTTMNSKNKYRNKADLYSKFYYINPWLQWPVKTNIEIKLLIWNMTESQIGNLSSFMM